MIKSSKELITTKRDTSDGFIGQALKKAEVATEYVTLAKKLRKDLSNLSSDELLENPEIREALISASGISTKARKHLSFEEQNEAVKRLIDSYIDKNNFADDIVSRYLLTLGDTLGGKMRNITGNLAEYYMTETLMGILEKKSVDFYWLDKKSKKWKFSEDNPATDVSKVKGLSWTIKSNSRTLVYNLNVPKVNKNVDLCLFDCSSDDYVQNKHDKELSSYIALGELKGGIDPAGADEHWKTANSALERIRTAFAKEKLYPCTFFIGAAIETAMASEIFEQLRDETLTMAANLNHKNQLHEVCKWIIKGKGLSGNDSH